MVRLNLDARLCEQRILQQVSAKMTEQQAGDQPGGRDQQAFTGQGQPYIPP
ncbi:hypothetical protein D3C81_2098600 [compost metagenome]